MCRKIWLGLVVGWMDLAKWWPHGKGANGFLKRNEIPVVPFVW